MIARIGTSGWSYPDWRGRFYPGGVSPRDWLVYYASRFLTVEVNMTFYRYPGRGMVAGWYDKTPADFRFTLKANRDITHKKKLRDIGSELRSFYFLADGLKDKLGCILFQLPPSMSLDLNLLGEFLSALDKEKRNAIEFRHESWFAEPVYGLLRESGVIFCNVSSAKMPATALATAPAAYVRFHGLTGQHRYDYSGAELGEWANKIRSLGADETYVYFNNDYHAHAPANAEDLRAMLDQA